MLRPSTARFALTLPGEIEGSRDAMLAAALGGYVERVHVREGDAVRRGQILATIDAELHAAQREQAAAQLERAEDELRRAERLAGAVPEAQLEAARSNARAARAAFRAADARARRASIVAPFAGVVASVAVEAGEVAAPGAPVIRLVAIDPVTIRVAVADRDVRSIQPGLEARIRASADGAVHAGRVVVVHPVADLRTRAFEVEIEAANPDRALLPGMIATVELASDVPGDRAVVPQDALVTRLTDVGVFVVENGRSRFAPLRLGPVLRDQVVVDSGLAFGDELVVRGHRGLGDGDEVLVARRGICCEDGRARFPGTP